jgi:hypothetical protein
MLQINCVFLIHQAYCNYFNYVKSLVSNYGLTFFLSIVYYFNNFNEMYIIFCFGEYTLVVWHQSMWLDKTLYI